MLNVSNKKTLTDVLEKWFGTFSSSFNCVKVGKITSVNTSNQTVDVQILHKRVDDTNITKRVLKEYPLLQQVPFVVLGGGQSNITFPISVGDNCLVFFCDYEIDNWWNTGEARPSNFERRHDISDSFALIGVHSVVDLLVGYSQFVQIKYSNESYITIGQSIDIINQQTNVSGKLDVTDDVKMNAKLNVTDDVKMNAKLNVTDDIEGNKKIKGEVHSTNGISGTFVDTPSGKSITFVDGIITSMS